MELDDDSYYAEAAALNLDAPASNSNAGIHDAPAPAAAPPVDDPMDTDD
jgi:hypothetical protein